MRGGSKRVVEGYYLVVRLGVTVKAGEGSNGGGLASPAVQMEALPTERRRRERRQGWNGGKCVGFYSGLLPESVRWCGLERWLGEVEVVGGSPATGKWKRYQPRRHRLRVGGSPHRRLEW